MQHLLSRAEGSRSPRQSPAYGECDRMNRDDTVGVADASRLLSVAEHTLCKWFDDGIIRGSRNAQGHRRIPRSEIARRKRQQIAARILLRRRTIR